MYCLESFLCNEFRHNNFWIFSDESSLFNIVQYDDINYWKWRFNSNQSNPNYTKYKVQLFELKYIHRQNRKSFVYNMIKFWWIMKRNTIHSCYYVTALGKLRAQCNVWTWYHIFFYYCLQFSTQVYQNITVLLGHIKTMKPSRCWLDVCDLIFYEKSNLQKYTFG